MFKLVIHKSWQWLCRYFNNTRVQVVAAFFVAIAFVVMGVYFSSFLVFTSTLQQFSLFVLLLAYSLTFIIFFTFSNKFRIFLNRHDYLKPVLTLMLPVVIFSCQFAVLTLSHTQEIEDSLRQSNNYNFKFFILADQDGMSDLHTFNWSELESDIYKKNYGYISKNYTLDCKNNYASLAYSIDEFNALNRQRQNLSIEQLHLDTATQTKIYIQLDKQYTDMQLQLGAIIKERLSYVVGKCQDFKQRKSIYPE